MALEAWLVKAKTAISNTLRTTTTSTTKMMYSKRSHVVGVLAFEMAGLMSKILHLWQSLSDKNVVRLRNEATSLEGVRKIVSNDDNFLLGLACAEVVENLRIVGKSVSRLCKRSNDPSLQCFDQFFEEFANSGRDSLHWEWSCKEMEVKLKKIDRYVTLTACLHKEIDELSDIEHGLKKLLQCSDAEQLIKEKKIIDLQQKVFWQKQEVKYLKETSLWSRNFDMVALLLARSLFTIV
ncbi:Phosphatidate cytidylyltransferase, partial [Thalictrum thalictroides]